MTSFYLIVELKVQLSPPMMTNANECFPQLFNNETTNKKRENTRKWGGKGKGRGG
jgi:hypothetical protein